MAQRPSQPDDAWERSMMKGLDALFAQEHERGAPPSTPAPSPDTKDRTHEPSSSSVSQPLFGPEDSLTAPRASDPGGRDPDIDAMLSAFERHADSEPESQPSVSHRTPLPGDPPQNPPGPVLVHTAHESEPRRAVLSAIAEGFGGASRFAAGLGSRTKDYLGSARSNFTRPVFTQPKRSQRKTSLRIDGREAAVIALSIVGLAEVGWIGWRVTNSPQTAVVVNRGVKSSEAATIAAPPAPAARVNSAPPASSRAKSVAARPTSTKSATPVPEVTAMGGKASGWVTISSSAPVDVFERGRKVASSRSGRLMLSAGRHDLEFRNKALGIHTRRTVDVVADSEASVALDVQAGSVNVNALPWASVSIDGAPVGDTPLANLPLAAGPHDVVFKHPEFGERRVKVTVTAGTPLRVSTDLRSTAK
jgi:hypothetical protein